MCIVGKKQQEVHNAKRPIQMFQNNKLSTKTYVDKSNFS